MRPEEEHRLKQLLRTHLPRYYADIISASQDTFAQPIYTVEVPAYHCGRICLIGDAGAVAVPMTGSGVFKGITNAIDLVTALQAGGDLATALVEWDTEQMRIGQRLVALSKQLEQALIWATPDFSALDAVAAEEWYHRAVTLPRQPR